VAKPLELVIKIKGKEAKSFLAKMSNPPRNKERENTLRRAKAMKKMMASQL
jgi:hypothetical protein